jgi:glycosyltransferase involved in cell wall biosynthesis
MRIFFVTNNYTPYTGGVTRSIIAITDGLRARGHEVFIVTLDFLGSQHTDPDYVFRIPCPIKFIYKNNHMAIPWRPTHAISRLLKKYDPDIVHVHHPFLLGVSALRATRKQGIPCIFTYHTLYEQYAHYVPMPSICSKPLIQSAVRHFCNKVDSIIAPSSAVKFSLQTQQITTPISVIPSPLRSLFFTQFDISLGQPLLNRPFHLIVVSRFVPEKNIPFVFDVFKQLPHTIHLTLVGYGNDYESLKSTAFNALQLPADRVRFVHKPTQEELLQLYRSADLFIFPSQTDTQGLVLAEAMSQGLPVVALDGPGQRDIIRNGINGFIVNNAQQAAVAIKRIAKNRVFHAKLSSSARITAQDYQINTIVNQLLTFYQTTLHSSPITL